MGSEVVFLLPAKQPVCQVQRAYAESLVARDRGHSALRRPCKCYVIYNIVYIRTIVLIMMMMMMMMVKCRKQAPHHRQES